jgi:hypothetical protein
MITCITKEVWGGVLGGCEKILYFWVLLDFYDPIFWNIYMRCLSLNWTIHLSFVLLVLLVLLVWHVWHVSLISLVLLVLLVVCLSCLTCHLSKLSYSSLTTVKLSYNKHVWYRPNLFVITGTRYFYLICSSRTSRGCVINLKFRTKCLYSWSNVRLTDIWPWR